MFRDYSFRVDDHLSVCTGDALRGRIVRENPAGVVRRRIGLELVCGVALHVEMRVRVDRRTTGLGGSERDISAHFKTIVGARLT